MTQPTFAPASPARPSPSGTLSLVSLVALAAALGCQRPGGDEPDPHAPEAMPAAVEAPTRPEVADPADWCDEHAVPESMCTLCHPELVEVFQSAGDFCAAHGLPESVCPLCHPLAPPGSSAVGAGDHGHDAHDDHGHEGHDDHGHAGEGEHVGQASDWCAEHAVPESMCTLCHPDLVASFRESGDWCAAHGFPESVCPLCNPMTPPTGAPQPMAFIPGTRVRFREPSLEEVVGLETVPAAAEPMGVGLETTARIEFNRNAMADVRSAFPGIVREVEVDLGQVVEAGATLFTLESAHVGELQAQRRAARERVEVAEANLERQQELHEGAIAAERHVDLARQELEAAEAELNAIEQSLRISGAPRSGRSGRFDIEAPIGGTVVRRPAVIGTYGQESDSLATIANTAVMWALLDVPEWDAAGVRTGQEVEIRVDGVAEHLVTGQVTWIASEVDPRTRTVAARAEVDNPHGLLRAGQFARATIGLEAPEGATTIPLQAVQRVGDESVVFVRTGEGLYEPRRVVPGRSDGHRVQVEGDVRAGDDVVTTGAFILRTELSPDAIGAGCCEVEELGED